MTNFICWQTLFVSVPPSLRISDSASILHVGPNATDRVVTCVSRGSRPKPSMKWYKNGQLLNTPQPSFQFPGIRRHLDYQNDTKGFTISVFYVEIHPDYYLVESVLTMSSEWYQNLDILTCQASTEVDTIAKTVLLTKPGKLENKNSLYWNLIQKIHVGLF